MKVHRHNLSRLDHTTFSEFFWPTKDSHAAGNLKCRRHPRKNRDVWKTFGVNSRSGIILDELATDTVAAWLVDALGSSADASGDTGWSRIEISIKYCKRSASSSVGHERAVLVEPFLTFLSSWNDSLQFYNARFRNLRAKERRDRTPTLMDWVMSVKTTASSASSWTYGATCTVKFDGTEAAKARDAFYAGTKTECLQLLEWFIGCENSFKVL